MKSEREELTVPSTMEAMGLRSRVKPAIGPLRGADGNSGRNIESTDYPGEARVMSERVKSVKLAC